MSKKKKKEKSRSGPTHCSADNGRQLKAKQGFNLCDGAHVSCGGWVDAEEVGPHDWFWI